MKNLRPHSVTLPFAHPELIGQPLLLFGAFYMEEIWKEIKDYPNYEVSNLGRIKSLKFGKETIIKQFFDAYGYYMVSLSEKKKGKKCFKVHKLVSIAFLNHIPCGYKLVINHKNFIRTDNRVENLEVITQRENTTKKHLNHSSSFTGVTWDKSRCKWVAQIIINNKNKHLGSSDNEFKAFCLYNTELNKLINH